MTTNPTQRPGQSEGRGSGAQFSAADLSARVSAGPVQQHCPNCGTETLPGVTVCTGCGIRLRKSARQIRCRHCHHKASSQLMICPSCGRHLRPAPSRLLTWGLPILLALAIGLLLFDRLGVRIQVGGDQSQTVVLGEMVDLPLIPTNTPLAETSGPSTVEAVVLPTETVAPVLVAEQPTATATPEPSATASPTLTATATLTATFTATPTPAPTLDAMSYTVQTGDTPAGIARRFGVTVDELLAANDLTLADATRIRAGTVLVIPAGGNLSPTATPITPAAPPTATSTPAPAVSYTLRAGDTLIGIATRFGITVNNLLAANGLTAQDAPTLQVGTVMVIPAAGQSFPTPTPTSAPATPAPAPVQASPTPAPTQPPTLRLGAPVLLSPSSGTPILGCSSLQLLTWQAVSLGPGDEYELHLGYVSGPPQADGNETISWVVFVRQTQLSWKLDTTLCTQAPQEYNRQWRWYVQIVNGNDAVSPPSSVWEFSWNP